MSKGKKLDLDEVEREAFGLLMSVVKGECVGDSERVKQRVDAAEKALAAVTMRRPTPLPWNFNGGGLIGTDRSPLKYEVTCG